MSGFEFVVFIILLVLVAILFGYGSWLFGGGSFPSWWPSWLGGPTTPPPPPPAVAVPPVAPPAPPGGRYIINISGPVSIGPNQTIVTATVNYNPGGSWTGMTQQGHTVKAFIHPGSDNKVTSTLDGMVQSTSDASGKAYFRVRATQDGEEDELEATISNLSPGDSSSAPVTSGKHRYSTTGP